MWTYSNLITMLITYLIFALISFININPYKFNLIEYIEMALIIVSAYVLIYIYNSKLAAIAPYIIPAIYLYKKNKKVVRSIMLQTLICSITVIVYSCVFDAVILVFGDKFIEGIAGFCITYIFIAVVLYFASKLIGKLIIKHRDVINRNSKSKYLFMAYVILVITFTLFYVNINWNNASNLTYLSKLNAFIFMIYGIIMLLICCTLFFIIRKEEKFRYEQIELENLKGYTENLEELYMDMRKFRHDYINIISSMAGLIEEGDIDALRKHFNQYIYPINTKINKNNYKLGLLKNVELAEVKGLISAKIIRAQELGIDTMVDIVEPITNINMDIIDLSRILGILLDNAIEAALESDKKNIKIALIKKNKSVIIVIINSFKGEILSISRLFKEGFSTKGEMRGLGLSNLKEIISRYDNVLLDTCIKDQEFIQEISISSK